MTFLKICGMRSEADLEACKEADYHGFILNSDSPRCLSVKKAAHLMGKSKALRVMVTTETDLSKIEALVHELHPDVLQLHSKLSGREVQAAAFFVPEVWALVPMGMGGEQERLECLAGCCDGVVLDSACACGGGSGRTHDWTQSAKLRVSSFGKVILAGGLRAENVPAAVRTVRPHGIDVSSGIERDGGKDRHFFEELRTTLRRVDDEQR